MKRRIFALFLAAAMLLSLAGCRRTDDGPDWTYEDAEARFLSIS